MLKRIHIENFALVDCLDVDFEPGMNVLTGETGAGKSVIVGALAQVLGEKADKDDVRSGSDLAVIEAVFDGGKSKRIASILNDAGIDMSSDEMVLRKEIPLARAARIFVNDQLVTLAQLKPLTAYLAELFGQHAHQQLLDDRYHLSFLDHFANQEDAVDEARDRYEGWHETRRQLAALLEGKERAKNERDLLLFQQEEIETADIRVGEEEEILAEKRILDSSRELGEKSGAVLDLLESDDSGAMPALGLCHRELSHMAELDKALVKRLELLDTAMINLDELRTEIEAYRSSIPDDPERLEEINARLDELYRLKKKYGGTEETILATLTEINTRLEKTIDVEAQLSSLKKQEMQLFDEYAKLAVKISEARQTAAKKLAKLTITELTELGMADAGFEFEFLYEPDADGVLLGNSRVRPGPEGLETGRFLFTANPGEPLKPLSKIASGGEISRVMLAVKAADKRDMNKDRRLLVFDEIDAGIGGATANAVAKRLARLAKNFQLLVITHLHQIALVSNDHYAVQKVSEGKKAGRNIITIKRLDESEKGAEIDRMLSLPDNKAR
ncbi:MAG: DNA repair protein RecN [candidate division Zixibacteria bacterium]|nr:DNA repair protein RecN [candidate division Zixibacteria bacterium]